MPQLLIDLHLALGLGLLAVVALLLVTALPQALRRQPPPGLFVPLRRLAAALLGVQVMLGAILLASGRRPQTTLHVVYAAAALLTMPVARALARRSDTHGRYYVVGGTLLLLGLVFRLISTG